MSSSSGSYTFMPYVRQCRRLTEPADTTREYVSADGLSLSIFADIPYSLLRSVAANLPSSGPDLVTFSYVDTQGTAGVLTFNVSLWCSDNGYCFVSADNSVQFLIASVNGNFFDANAQTINQRNVNAGVPQLLSCANASRYDWPSLLVNHNLPTVFVYDGVLLGGGSSSSSG